MRIKEDIHTKAPDVSGIELNRVGVSGVPFPLTVKGKGKQGQQVKATIDMFGSLRHDIKGTNMSRFCEALSVYSRTGRILNGGSFRSLLEDLLMRLNKGESSPASNDVFVKAKFSYKTVRYAPVSRRKSFMYYDCAFIGVYRNKAHNFIVEVKVPVTSLCPCCFLPGTPVFLKDDVVYIEEAHKNSYSLENKKIEDIFVYPSKGKSYVEIKQVGTLPIRCSSDHKIKIKVGDNAIWKEAGTLSKGDLVMVPKIKNYKGQPQVVNLLPYIKKVEPQKNNHLVSTFKVDRVLGKLFGLFMAEGHAHLNKNNVGYTEFWFNKEKEQHLVQFVKKTCEKYFKTKVTLYDCDETNTTRVIISRSAFTQFMYNSFRDNLKRAKVPDFIMKSPPEVIKEFILGWYLGDGSHMTFRKTQRIDTTSQRAALQLQLLCLKLGYFMFFTTSKASHSNTFTRGGYKSMRLDLYHCWFNLRLMYYLGLVKDVPRYKNYPIIEDSINFYIPVKEVTKINYDGNVYDLQVKNTQYTIPYIVHNSKSMCLDDPIKELGQGAHNQRGVVTVQLATDPCYPGAKIEDIIECVEDSSSSKLYTILKRPDEEYVTRAAYKNPKFVEDIARESIARLKKLNKVSWIRVKVENYESIHMHSAVAYCEYAKDKNKWVNTSTGFY